MQVRSVLPVLIFASRHDALLIDSSFLRCPGVFGYVAVDGTTDFAVVIRTMVIRGDRECIFRFCFGVTQDSFADILLISAHLMVELQLGGGGAITHLSDPEKEWEEVLVKVEAVIGRRNGSL